MEGLTKKLFELRGRLGRVSKDRKGYNYKYADLGACHDEVDSVLTDLGLVWVTLPGCTSDGRAGVHYRLIDCDTGDAIEGDLYLPMVDGDPQKAGSAITYARRYALAALGLITEEDDDGAKATKPRKRANPKAEAKKFITEDEKQSIVTACRKKADEFYPDDESKADAEFKNIGKMLVAKFGVTALGAVPAGKAKEALEWVNSRGIA